MNKVPKNWKFYLNKFFGALAIFLSILLIAFFALALTFGWWADPDYSEEEIEIVGNIKISGLDLDSTAFELVFYESSSRSVPIVLNCRVLYYDSQDSIFWAEERFNEISNYYKLQVIDADKKLWYNAVNKTEITNEEFKRSINDKMKKWTIQE